MAIQQRPKFYSDLLPGREFDTPDEAETAEIEHKTRERAQQYVQEHQPYISPKFNARMVDTIVHWELWNLGRLPGQQGQAEPVEDPPDDPDYVACTNCDGEMIVDGDPCVMCGGAGRVFPV